MMSFRYRQRCFSVETVGVFVVIGCLVVFLTFDVMINFFKLEFISN